MACFIIEERNYFISRLENKCRDWIKLSIADPEDEFNKNYLANSILLVPGIELLIHIQPKDQAEATKIAFTSDTDNENFTHYSSKKFSKGEIYGSSLFIKPSNLNLLLGHNTIMEGNVFETVLISIRNSIGKLSKDIKEVAKVIRFWEEGAGGENPAEEKALRYQLTRDALNFRMLNYFRYWLLARVDCCSCMDTTRPSLWMSSSRTTAKRPYSRLRMK
eukprot:TRINITY_DN10377_c0_g1_i7.p1 TRINITY_DN10377_c0_g1~~TRINITY_DN10377_c0_g1_i7.p1  ORF type:complete len:219 (-),score=40.21 TRINITY_DN10377_c0_g1_i7:374-1030(-)